MMGASKCKEAFHARQSAWGSSSCRCCFAGRQQGGCRPARSLGRGRGWPNTRRPCGKSSFPSCGFSVPFFRFFRYSSKRESRSCPNISRCCICPVRSYCVSLSFVIVVFRVCTLSICPRRPESRESIRRRCAAPLHRNRTSPPSLWPGRELRKYHCPQHLSSPPPGAARLLSCKLYRSLMWVPVKVRDFDGRGGAAQ